jgi:hypothetical protein
LRRIVQKRTSVDGLPELQAHIAIPLRDRGRHTSLLHAAEARQIIGSPSELRPMAPSQSARYGNRAVHYGHHERPCLYVFRDTGSAFVSLGQWSVRFRMGA